MLCILQSMTCDVRLQLVEVGTHFASNLRCACVWYILRLVSVTTILHILTLMKEIYFFLVQVTILQLKMEDFSIFFTKQVASHALVFWSQISFYRKQNTFHDNFILRCTKKGMVIKNKKQHIVFHQHHHSTYVLRTHYYNSISACMRIIAHFSVSCSLLTTIFACVEQRGPREKVTNDEATAGIIRHTYPYTTKGQKISEGIKSH